MFHNSSDFFFIDMSKEINLMLSTYAKILRQVPIVYFLESLF